MKSKKSLEVKIHEKRIKNISIFSSLIFFVLCLTVYGMYYTQINIIKTDNSTAIIATVYMSIIITLCITLVMFLYSRISTDKYDLFYNVSLDEMATGINTRISIYNNHSVNKAKDEGLKEYKYFELKISEKAIDDIKEGKGK